MSAIETRHLWEQNAAILKNTPLVPVTDGPVDFVPFVSPQPKLDPGNSLVANNEGIMYSDHVNTNNKRAQQRRDADKKQIEAMDAATLDPVVKGDKAPLASVVTPAGGPAIVSEGAQAGNGGGVASQGAWKPNA